MIPAEFEYVAPDSIAAAVSALTEAGEDAKVLAGEIGRASCRERVCYPV